MTSTATILDAAERIFAIHGYDGASMRRIAAEAGVAAALIHYHFDTKEKLYAAVFERRAGLITKRREHLLDEMLAREEQPTLEDVLEIMLTSVRDVFAGQPQNMRLYVRMVASLEMSGDDLSQKLVSAHYDPTARKFIAALRRVVPKLTEDEAVWAYLFMLGARMQAHALGDRALRLGADPPGAGVRSPYSMLVAFAAGGIRSLAATGPVAAFVAPRGRASASGRE